MGVESYRQQFSTTHDAERYDTQQYGPGAYSQLLWTLEKRFLRRIISRMPDAPCEYLDFACGTGRVLSFVEPYVQSATGIDISESMLALAERKTRRAVLKCEDITQSRAVGDQRYDLITAFRFVLNAEDELRRNALRALALRLRSRGSRLVFNNHGNPFSHKAFMWPYHRLHDRERGSYRPTRNYLTHRQITNIAAEAGLEIIDVVGYGHLSAKALHLFDFDTVLQMEEFFAGRPVASRFGAVQMYVTRPIRRAS